MGVGRTLPSYPDLLLILAEGRRSEPGDASLVRERGRRRTLPSYPDLFLILAEGRRSELVREKGLRVLPSS